MRIRYRIGTRALIKGLGTFKKVIRMTWVSEDGKYVLWESERQDSPQHVNLWSADYTNEDGDLGYLIGEVCNNG